VQFKRSEEISGYSFLKLEFKFVPFKLTKIEQHFSIFFENQDHSEPIPIRVVGECVDVPIYVQQEEYDLNVLVYDQFYRKKVVLVNRSTNSMKI
jgi:hypothetical protein